MDCFVDFVNMAQPTGKDFLVSYSALVNSVLSRALFVVVVVVVVYSVADSEFVVNSDSVVDFEVVAVTLLEMEVDLRLFVSSELVCFPAVAVAHSKSVVVVVVVVAGF